MYQTYKPKHVKTHPTKAFRSPALFKIHNCIRASLVSTQDDTKAVKCDWWLCNGPKLIDSVGLGSQLFLLALQKRQREEANAELDAAGQNGGANAVALILKGTFCVCG